MIKLFILFISTYYMVSKIISFFNKKNSLQKSNSEDLINKKDRRKMDIQDAEFEEIK